jgi:hypothetical protein
MINDIKNITKYLFNCDFFNDDFDPEGKEEHLDMAHELQEKYPWSDIIDEWHNYLYTNCRTAEDVINYANLFFYYEGADEYNPDPYKFIGYLYARVNMDTYWEQAGDLFDSIAIDILSNQQLINLAEDPYYNPLKDKNIIDEIARWKATLYNSQ